MSTAQSRGTVIWEGSLARGTGTLSVGSRAFPDQAITWATRTERMAGKTSPEELIAGAHAGCYAMSLSNTLSKAGSVPEKLEVTATCTFQLSDDGARITTMDLEVRGRVQGIDQDGFERMAQQAEQGCPVSRALRNNVEIRLTAQLDPQV